MAVQRAEGIILRKYFLRETSYILVIFTKEFGKITGVMKGVRKPYPQFAGNFEIFALAEVLFYRKKKKAVDLITQCEALNFFLPIRKDVERTAYASYFLELVDIVANDYSPSEELYKILKESLNMLSGKNSAKRVSRIFELKFLETVGLSPHLDGCVSCGNNIEKKEYFSVKSGGILCAECSKQDSGCLKLSQGTVNFIKRIQKTDISKTSGIKTAREVGMETEELLGRFIAFHIGRKIKSLNFISQLNRKGRI